MNKHMHTHTNKYVEYIIEVSELMTKQHDHSLLPEKLVLTVPLI